MVGHAARLDPAAGCHRPHHGHLVVEFDAPGRIHLAQHVDLLRRRLGDDHRQVGVAQHFAEANREQ